MIRVKPDPENTFACPECGSAEVLIANVQFDTLQTVADCACGMCGFKFLRPFPAGHHLNAGLSVGKEDGRVRGVEPGMAWLASALSLYTDARAVKIEKKIYRKCDRVIFLNTLDSLYGHVLLKLWNAIYHLDHHREYGLVLVIPRIFEWLVPQGCAEVWIVDLKLGELDRNYEAIRDFFAGELKRFEEIRLSRTWSHPELGPTDISRLTGAAPFALREFREKRPQFTFVLREDRWWFPTVADYWIYRVCRKLGKPDWARRLLSRRQNGLVRSVIRRIGRQLPEAAFVVVGLGRTGKFPAGVHDLRASRVTPETERQWCVEYAQSHVVIGVHGSNMLLPTALAAGCVEILPEDRYGNMIQDLAVRYQDRKQLFLYRFADQFASARSVAAKATGMVRDFDIYEKNMCVHRYGDQAAMTSLPIVDDQRH